MAFPLLVIACLYAAILIKLKRKIVPGDRSSQTDPQGSRRRERNKNITKMSVCIVVAFALCYLPFYFFLMWPFIRTSPSTNFFFIALNLVYANGAVNPWILFYFCGNFRRGLRDMFGCNSCGCRTSSDHEVVEQNIELQIVNRNAPENWISVFSCETNYYGIGNEGVSGHYVPVVFILWLIPVCVSSPLLLVSMPYFKHDNGRNYSVNQFYHEPSMQLLHTLPVWIICMYSYRALSAAPTQWYIRRLTSIYEITQCNATRVLIG